MEGGGVGPELTIYSARYASPQPRPRPTQSTHTHHFHEYSGPSSHAAPGVLSGPSGAPLMSGQAFTGPLSLPAQGPGYWRSGPRRHQHHHHHHTFPPYPPVPPPPPRRDHYHPHGHQSLPHMGVREPPPPPSSGRWDEDPCLLRPHSPTTPCPHNPRVAPPQEDANCFVVMTGHPLPTVSAINPLHAPHRHQQQQQQQHLQRQHDHQQNLQRQHEQHQHNLQRQQQHHERQQQQRQKQVEEDAVYSYAGEGIVSPAAVILAQAALEDSDSGGSLTSENIYEEIPENWRGTWSRRSLVQEVLDEYERVRAGHKRVLSALNLDVEALIRPGPHDGTASPDSGLTVSASDSSCEPNLQNYDVPSSHSSNHQGGTKKDRSPPSNDRKNQTDGSPSGGKGRLVKCESLDFKDAFMRRPSGRGRGLMEKLGGVKEKIEKRGWRFPNFSKKGSTVLIRKLN
ncbi:hypothetical protein Pmani_022811 [Petrolisthes manimaculis]|uniref:Uncharacterized protein n=1 Tax=Petrolisthes manimaculis TaxID=1843537 RepID=A0AAE1U1R1_9EUCA|nr:hypothetical protein Pmani_022811 [Petrolisthes manimaculis]